MIDEREEPMNCQLCQIDIKKHDARWLRLEVWSSWPLQILIVSRRTSAASLDGANNPCSSSVS